METSNAPSVRTKYRPVVASFVLAGFLSLAATLTGVVAQEESAPDARESTPADDTRATPLRNALPAPADDDEARKRAYSLGIVMIGGILICGVGLLALTLLWGSRARRIARQPLPKVAPRDELWFLKRQRGSTPEPQVEVEDDENDGESAS